MIFNCERLEENLILFKKTYDKLKDNNENYFNENERVCNFSGEIYELILFNSFLYFTEKNEKYGKRVYFLLKKYFINEDLVLDKKGLGTYFELYYLSLSFSFCKESKYIKKIRSKVSNIIKILSEHCFFHGGKKQNQDPASNWKALRFSMAGIGFLSHEEKDEFLDTKIYGCLQRCKRYFQNNMKNGFAGMEGDSYTRYAWYGLGPFGMALENIKKWDFRKNSDYDIEWQIMWDLATFVPIETRDGFRGVTPDFVASTPTLNDLKFISLGFYYINEENLGGLKSIFDLSFGDISDTHGFIYLLLNYIPNLVDNNILENKNWRKSFCDTEAHGYFGYRNRFKDENDIVSQLYGKFSKTSGHKDICQCSFRITGLNTLWVVGDSYEKRNQNIIYPGGYGGPDVKDVWRPMKNNGKLFSYDYLNTPELQGYCITGVNAQTDFDVEKFKRRYVTKFNESGCSAFFICADTSLNARYWQLNTCPINDVEVNNNGFIIKDNYGNSLKATILYPHENYVVKTGERKRNFPYYIHNTSIEYNKFILIEREDPVPGMTEEMTIDKNRGLRNSLLYHRDEEGKLWKPRYETHEGDFIVVMTLCNSEQKHPEVTMEGDRILNGVTINVGGYKTQLEYESVEMGV